MRFIITSHLNNDACFQGLVAVEGNVSKTKTEDEYIYCLWGFLASNDLRNILPKCGHQVLGHPVHTCGRTDEKDFPIMCTFYTVQRIYINHILQYAINGTDL
jgi:hypothetical protein